MIKANIYNYKQGYVWFLMSFARTKNNLWNWIFFSSSLLLIIAIARLTAPLGPIVYEVINPCIGLSYCIAVAYVDRASLRPIDMRLGFKRNLNSLLLFGIIKLLINMSFLLFILSLMQNSHNNGSPYYAYFSLFLIIFLTWFQLMLVFVPPLLIGMGVNTESTSIIKSVFISMIAVFLNSAPFLLLILFIVPLIILPIPFLLLAVPKAAIVMWRVFYMIYFVSFVLPIWYTAIQYSYFDIFIKNANPRS